MSIFKWRANNESYLPSSTKIQFDRFLREQGFPALISALLGALLVIAVQAVWDLGHLALIPNSILSQVPGSILSRDQLVMLETSVVGVSLALSMILFACWWLGHIVNRHLRGLERANAFRVNVWRDDPRNRHVTAYDACNIAAQDAKSSIKVIGPHYRRELKATKSHDDYLTRGIMIALRKNAENLDNPFAYHRIVQIGGDLTEEETDAMMEELRETRCLKLRHVSDNSLFLHIANVLDWNSIPGMEVKIFARPYIPSMSSVLLIDRRHVFFSLPTPGNAPRDYGNASLAESHEQTSLIPKFRIWADAVAHALPDSALPAELRAQIKGKDHVSPEEFAHLVNELVPYAKKAQVAIPEEMVKLKLGFVFGVEDTGIEDGGGLMGSRFLDLFSKLTVGSVRIERVDDLELEALKRDPTIQGFAVEMEQTTPNMPPSDSIDASTST